jgi:hypothetical protein
MAVSKRLTETFYTSVIHNFEVSLVMPFYKKLREFSKVLPMNASFFQRNGIEVILVMDEPTEENGVLDLISYYPFINWKVIVNDQTHDPRNPAKVLNVGIRYATKRYIMVSSPETWLYTDVIFQLRNALEYYKDHYAIGTVAFIEEDTMVNDDTVNSLMFMPYGSFMVDKDHLNLVTGYDENFKKWGGEDDNIRRRLDMAGIRRLYIPESKSIHFEEKLKLKERLKKSGGFEASNRRRIEYPSDYKVNSESWGADFHRIVFDWKYKPDAGKNCMAYLKQFENSYIRDNNIFREKYNKLIICHSYNEIDMIAGFLENMSLYFDGVILLDDGSTDSSYEFACNEKILIKARKHREDYNELRNKNILLDIASFLNADWLCFMDIDERFMEPYTDFDQITKKAEINVATFCFIHLWDDEKHYSTIYPYTYKGLFRRRRMFRNTGHTQINSLLSKMHIEASPVKKDTFHSSIVVKHYGNIDKSRRRRRYSFYKESDTHNDQVNYDHLLCEMPSLARVDAITREMVEQSSVAF